MACTNLLERQGAGHGRRELVDTDDINAISEEGDEVAGVGDEKRPTEPDGLRRLRRHLGPEF